MKIGIVIHGVSTVNFDAYANHLGLIASLPKEHQYAFGTTNNVKIAQARNILFNDMLEKFNPDKILVLDTDHTFPMNMLHKLLQADADVVSGLICKRRDTFSQVGYVMQKDCKYAAVNIPLDSGIYYVDTCAFGCTLIDCAILKKLDAPIFYDSKSNRSDINFCTNVKKVGGKIAIHSGVLCGHIVSESIVVFPYNNHIIKEFTTKLKGIKNG